MGSVYLRSKTWWIKYYKQGKPHRESSGSSKKGDAERLLKLREGAVAKGEPLSLRIERIKVDELLDDVNSDYEVNGKSLDMVKLSATKLKAFFRGMRASQITTAHVNAYITKRKSETTRRGGPPSDASINRELSLLKRAYSLAKTSTPPKAHTAPTIRLLRENNAREGFIGREDYLALKAALPLHVRPILTTGYFTGMRLGEILNLRWRQVDLNRRLIRLEPSDTKNRTARTIYLGEELYQALAEIKAQTDWHWPGVEHVFVRDGQPIKGFKRAWQTACVAVGLGKKEERSVKRDKKGRRRKAYRYEGLLFHDLRRSAIRNLIRAGVSQATAMRISGHKTASTFRRYDIVSEDDLEQAARSLDAYHASVGTNLGTLEGLERALEEVQSGK
jgi:integrase